jgi:polysaccharide export outer membrane protein
MRKILKSQIDYDRFSKNLNIFKYNLLNYSGLSMLLMLLLLSSCYSSKSLDYLQNDSEKISKQIHPIEYMVQSYDVLDIQVQSRDPDQSALFNMSSLDNRNLQADPGNLFLIGHTVSREGTIHLAIVGEVKVIGLTVAEIRDLVQSEIDQQLLNAKVSVNLTSFKISVLGDVKNPGVNYFYNAQFTLFEALSAAGDLNLSAKRRDVRLIRQLGQESAIVVNLDLTDPNIIESPYYFLYPDDVIYVETSKQNIFRSNLGLITTFLSVVSTGILVWSVVNNER